MSPKDLPSHQKEILISRIKEMGPWFHNIEIAKDVYTNPNSDYPLNRWKVLEQHLPERLDGKVCLDIGCSSGFFSMKLRERNAEQIVGIDFGEQAKAIQQAEFAKETCEREGSITSLFLISNRDNESSKAAEPELTATTSSHPM